jgi:hypothetical protein
MSQDATESLNELRHPYSQHPEPILHNFELTLDRSWSDEPSETNRRISVVEECIFEVLHLEREEESSTNTRKGLTRKVVPVTRMAHVEALKTHPQPYMYPCNDTYHTLPNEPSKWPQRPLMIRPTPYTSMKILGIVRFHRKKKQTNLFGLLTLLSQLL